MHPLEESRVLPGPGYLQGGRSEGRAPGWGSESVGSGCQRVCLPLFYWAIFFLWISVSPPEKQVLDHTGVDLESGVRYPLLGLSWPLPTAPPSPPPLGTSHKECGWFKGVDSLFRLENEG